MPNSESPAGVLELTRQLVAIDSVNTSLSHGSAGEGAIAAFAAERLSAAGFETTIVPAPSDGRRPSVLAIWQGSRPGRTVRLPTEIQELGGCLGSPLA